MKKLYFLVFFNLQSLIAADIYLFSLQHTRAVIAQAIIAWSSSEHQGKEFFINDLLAKYQFLLDQEMSIKSSTEILSSKVQQYQMWDALKIDHYDGYFTPVSPVGFDELPFVDQRINQEKANVDLPGFAQKTVLTTAVVRPEQVKGVQDSPLVVTDRQAALMHRVFDNGLPSNKRPESRDNGGWFSTKKIRSDHGKKDVARLDSSFGMGH